MIKAFILATDGTHSQIALDVRSDTFPEDVRLSHIFPNGAVSYRLFNHPCTRARNVGDWRLFLSNDRAQSPRNLAVYTKFGREWFGNLILVKYSVTNPHNLESVQEGDRPLAYSMLNA